MSLQLGDAAPNFRAQTTEGEIDFYEYLGNSWGCYFLIRQTTPRCVQLN